MNPVDLRLLCFYATLYHSTEQKSWIYICINKNRPVDLLFYKQFLAEQRLESRATQSLIFHSQHKWTENFVESEQAWGNFKLCRGKMWICKKFYKNFVESERKNTRRMNYILLAQSGCSLFTILRYNYYNYHNLRLTFLDIRYQ